MPNMALISESIHDTGYYFSECAVDFQTFATTCQKLGQIYHRTDIKIDPASRTYFRSPRALALHNDDFDADYVAWYCTDPGTENVATVLLDEMVFWPDVPRELYPYLHDCYIKRNDEPDRPILREPHPSSPNLYFIPWNVVSPRTSHHQEAVNTLVRLIDKHTQSNLESIDHKKDHFLIIDNRRMLHGRPQTPRTTTRHLVRFWIRKTTAKNISPA